MKKKIVSSWSRRMRDVIPLMNRTPAEKELEERTWVIIRLFSRQWLWEMVLCPRHYTHFPTAIFHGKRERDSWVRQSKHPLYVAFKAGGVAEYFRKCDIREKCFLWALLCFALFCDKPWSEVLGVVGFSPPSSQEIVLKISARDLGTLEFLCAWHPNNNFITNRCVFISENFPVLTPSTTFPNSFESLEEKPQKKRGRRGNPTCQIYVRDAEEKTQYPGKPLRKN